MKTRNTPHINALLEKLKQADKAVANTEGRLANLRMMTTDTSVHLSDMPHADSPDQQKLLTLLTIIADLEKDLERMKRDIAVLQNRLSICIGSMEIGTQQRYIAKVLLDHKTIGKIAAEEKYSRSMVEKQLCRGYCQLEQIYDTIFHEEERNDATESENNSAEIQ